MLIKYETNLKEETIKALTSLEQKRLLQKIKRSGNKRNFALVLLILNTGCGIQELIRLNRSDIVMSERKGFVRIMKKESTEQIIQLNVTVRRALRQYLQERNDNQAALFLSRFKNRISKQTVLRMLEKYNCRPHQLQLTFIQQSYIKNDSAALWL